MEETQINLSPSNKPIRIKIFTPLFWALAFGITLLLVSLFFLFMLLQPRLPQAAIVTYLDLSSTARQADAGIYAEDLVRRAGQKWEQARLVLHWQNNRFFILRRYDSAEKYILTANGYLRTAIQRTRSVKDSLRLTLNLKTMYLHNQIEQYRIKFDQVPVTTELREHIIRGELLVREGDYLLSRKEYATAATRLEEAAGHIAYADSNLSKEIAEYLGALPAWQEWIKETRDLSRATGKTVIIVDKMEHVCRVYQADTLRSEIPIEMGPNWIGTKKQIGDKRTPEGKYIITKKRRGRETRFYKALQLNYPNEEDWLRFYSAIRNAEIPADAKIGGLIEIHGEGGKGVNWTDGCIAISNEDIDQIFELVEVGTPVTIVGSTKVFQINSNHSNNHLN